MAGKKGMKHYPLEFREKVALERLQNDVTLQELKEKYDIPSVAQIYNWCKWYEMYGVCKQKTGKHRGRPRKTYKEN